MPTLADIARDPQKALRDLEKKLGAQPGELLAQMEALGDGSDDWTQHLPFDTARAYYSNTKLRQAHEAHVNRCSLCQSFLKSLHPRHPDTATFAGVAARTTSLGAWVRRVATSVMTRMQRGTRSPTY